MMTSCPRRAGRPHDQLEHPDEKSISSNHTYGDHRPDKGGDDGEYDQFCTQAGPVRIARLSVSAIQGADHETPQVLKTERSSNQLRQIAHRLSLQHFRPKNPSLDLDQAKAGNRGSRQSGGSWSGMKLHLVTSCV